MTGLRRTRGEEDVAMVLGSTKELGKRKNGDFSTSQERNSAHWGQKASNDKGLVAISETALRFRLCWCF